MNVRFNGIGDLVATFQTASAELGDVVKISENGTVEKAGDSDGFCGQVVSKNGGYVGVQIKGAMELPCTDSTLELGRAQIVPDGNNGVKKAAEGGVAALIVEKDTSANMVTLIV
uniref:Uncharacterized protein n=1 Tax=virus sp. ctWpE22 TaxID=2826805 RepID=A0A8S5R7A9_9VIRU|nr:MAG TPA: hypothetical protein [virus sp. ctWpE22]